MRIANMKKSETTEQINLFNWALRNLDVMPELELMYHVPNEGKRTNGDILKAAGMKAGVPDVVLPVARKDFHGLYLEMKFGKNKTTKDQERFMELLRQQKYKTVVCYGFEEARKEIRAYLQYNGEMPLEKCEEAPKIFNQCSGYMLGGSGFLPVPYCECCKHLEINKHRIAYNGVVKQLPKSKQATIQDLMEDLAISGHYGSKYTMEQRVQDITDLLAQNVKEEVITIQDAAVVTDLAIQTYQDGIKYNNRKGNNQ